MSARLWWVGIVVLLSFVTARSSAQTANPPVIASLSNSQTVTEGQAVTLSVSANGTAPFTYQWQKGGVSISGATSSSLTFDPIRTTDGDTYTVVVTNSAASITSGPVLLAVNPAVAPTFGYQPGDVITTVGSTLNLSTYANGTAPFTYTWMQGGTIVGTTTGGSYSKANAQTTDSGTYTVKISNIAGSITSSPFTVTINPLTAPTISTIADLTVNTGDSIWIFASVTSNAPATYQWSKDGVPISGAISYYYSASGAQASDAGNYTLTATNSAGSTTSNAAKLTVRPPVAPTISSISGPVTVAVGGSFSLSVYVNGTGPISYQWSKDGVAISGATGSYYSKSGVQLSDTGAYSVVVSNLQGSVTSSAATVTVTNAQPPVITYMPSSFAFRQGDSIYSISVGATGTGTLAYQWSKDAVALAGQTSSTLYFNHTATTADAGTYTVTVTNSQGSVSSPGCKITILPPTPPTISYQIPSQALHQGQSLSLGANVAGSSPITYQWRKDGQAIAGATNSYYSIASIASSDSGVYSYIATNAAGAVTSSGATITVLAAAAPTITADPASASLLPGDSFYGMYVAYRANPTATVQWYKDGQPVPGANSGSFSIYNAQPSNAGTYTAVVTNSAGSVTSRQAVITVDSNVTRPVITMVSGSQAVAGGSAVSMSISTSGSGETVLWYKDGVLIPNGTGKSYYFSNFTAAGAGTYTAQVTNATGTYTSRAIVLTLLDAGVAPTITQLTPGGLTLATGQYANFSVAAEGETPFTYQWNKDGTAIPGATSSNYGYTATASTAGNYTVTVTNRNGSATSGAAALVVASAPTGAPVITSGPASQTLTIGSGGLSLSVSLLDSTGATYQWYKDGVAVNGGTGAYLYNYANVQASSAGRYHVVVTNSAGTTTSDDAVVAVTTATTGPVITTQPLSQNGYYGNAITFTAAATGTGTISYQWKKDGSPLNGATTTSFAIANAQSTDVGTYTVVATDSTGSTSSQAAVLTLAGGTAPSIVTSPSSNTIVAGGSATFTGSAAGNPTPTLQWQKNGADIPGATTTTLVISNAQSADAGSYTLIARNGVGSATSAAATLTVVYPAPTITAQPTNASVQTGGLVQFTVGANAQPQPQYQWRKNGTNIAGASSSTLVLTNVQPADAGRYSVVITTAFGSVTSVDAILTVGNPITVTAPTSQTVTAGTGAQFTVGVASIDPLLFQWAKNGTAITGATSTTLTLTNVQVADEGTYTMSIKRTDGTVVYPLTGAGALYATLTVLPPVGPIFQTQPSSTTAAAGAAVTLRVQVQGTGTVTYQWYKNGQSLGVSGATLTLSAVRSSDAGDYTVVATDANGSTTSAVAHLTVTAFQFAGVYFGSTGGGDSWALSISDDGKGTFLGILSGQNEAIIARGFAIGADGTFTFGSPTTRAAARVSTYTSWLYSGTVSGTISNGAVNGQVPGLQIGFTGMQKTGGQASSAGSYTAVPVAAGLGEVDAIAAADGTVMLIAVDSTGVRGGRGTVAADGTFTVPQPQYKYVGQLSGATGSVQGNYMPTSGASVPFATPAAANGNERLVNVSTRGLTAPGLGTLTAGFVITGSDPKDVLIRAVGPGLTSYGVTGVLANPRLRVYKDTTPIMDNDDWGLSGFATQVADTSTRVGAFALANGSADAAVVARLVPGSYTVQVTASDGVSSGVVLVEAYDATTTPSEPQRLVNVSTRGPVDQAGNILVAGVVVRGSSPKKLLIRGVGPALSAYGVTGVLADPKLQLFQNGTVIGENDNWSDSADASAIAAAANAVGAFPLAPGSKDAAMLLYLSPGGYTAQLSGASGTSGIALVEVYEVP